MGKRAMPDKSNRASKKKRVSFYILIARARTNGIRVVVENMGRRKVASLLNPAMWVSFWHAIWAEKGNVYLRLWIFFLRWDDFSFPFSHTEVDFFLSRPLRALKIKRKRSKILMMKISRPRSEGNWRAYSPTRINVVNSSPCRWKCRVVSRRLCCIPPKKRHFAYALGPWNRWLVLIPDSDIHASWSLNRPGEACTPSVYRSTCPPGD